MKTHIVSLTFMYSEEDYPEITDKQTAVAQAQREIEEQGIYTGFDFDYRVDANVQILEEAGHFSKEQAEILSGWICTDPDTDQFGRRIEPGIYEFKETVRLPGGTAYPKQEIVDLSQFTVEEKIEALATFGYTLESVKRELPDPDWILAECIFESQL